MISMLRELLTFLGAHFYLVLIGCGELVLAVILLTALSERRNGARRRVPVTVPGSGPEQLMLRELAEREKVAAYERWLHQAEEASQFKTSFLFRMSHEI